MNLISKLKKTKKRRFVVIFSNRIQGGIQSMYISNSSSWEIISHAFIPYPQKITSLLEQSDQQGDIKLSDFAWLDFKLSILFLDAIKAVLMQVPTAQRTPHYIIVNKPILYKGNTNETVQQSSWDIPLGDAQIVASTFGTAVITDFIRHNLMAGGRGLLPTNPGDQIIASRCSGIGVFINLGTNCRMTIIDPATVSIIIDSDTGPGTLLLDKTFYDMNRSDRFDRDGSFAAQGKVDGNCLNILSDTEWFLKSAPKEADHQFFRSLLEIDALKSLSPSDLAATLTALSARTAYDFFKREYRANNLPKAIYVSGGGVNNLTLMEFLSTYFSPVPVLSIEKIGVPPELRIPLALGLTVDSYISGTIAVPWETGNSPRVEPLGRWIEA